VGSWTWSQTVPSSPLSRMLTYVGRRLPLASMSVFKLPGAVVGPMHHSVRRVFENLTRRGRFWLAFCRGEILAEGVGENGQERKAGAGLPRPSARLWGALGGFVLLDLHDLPEAPAVH
jgi:hypothetical protein